MSLVNTAISKASDILSSYRSFHGKQNSFDVSEEISHYIIALS